MRIEKRILFKQDEELSDYLFVSATFRLDDLRPHLEMVQTEVIEPLIGSDQLNELLTKYHANEQQLSDLEKQTIHALRYPLANYAFQRFIPRLQLDISTAGIRINVNENYKTAFQWQIEDLEFATDYESGTTYEQALEYLNKNKSDLPLYRNGYAYERNHRYFLNSAKEYDAYHNIRGFRRIYLHMLSIMESVEDIDIAAILGSKLYTDIKHYVLTGLTNSPVSGDDVVVVSDDSSYELEANKHYKVMLKYIRYIVANLTFHRAVNQLNLVYDSRGFLQYQTNNTQSVNAWKPADKVTVSNNAEAAKILADKYIDILKKYLIENANEIPLYVLPVKPVGYGRVEQNADNGFFIALGTHN